MWMLQVASLSGVVQETTQLVTELVLKRAGEAQPDGRSLAQQEAANALAEESSPTCKYYKDGELLQGKVVIIWEDG
jgi:hypothetical protein